MRRLTLLSLFLLSLLIAGCSGSRTKGPHPPRLVVVISIDQMRADFLTRFADQYSGGLARVTVEGVQFTQAHQDHAITATAPGHAVISTGTYPRNSGIIANSWWSAEAGRTIYAVEDTVGLTEDPQGLGSSPVQLNRSTVGDWLKEAYPKSKVFSVALKDRAAVLMGGHQADAAYWYHGQKGDFITSTYYLDSYPGWVRSFNEARLVDSFLSRGWHKLLDDEAYSASREDAFRSEANGRETTFPHLFPSNTHDAEYYSDLTRTPFGDSLAFAFAQELIRREKLGRDKTPDLLFLGASAADAIGHAFGPFSQEAQDYYLRLDGMLASFLDYLDQEVGADQYVVVLTSDHGVLPMPEDLSRRGIEAGRIPVQQLLLPLIEKTRIRLGLERIPTVYSNGFVLNPPSGSVSESTLQMFRQVLADTMRTLDVIADVFTSNELLDSNTPDRPFLEQYRRTFPPSHTPDIMLRLKEYHLPFANPTSTTHESPYVYDTHVPLLFLSDLLMPAQSDEPVSLVDLAPTLAALLYINPPEGLDGQELTPVLMARETARLALLERE